MGSVQAFDLYLALAAWRRAALSELLLELFLLELLWASCMIPVCLFWDGTDVCLRVCSSIVPVSFSASDLNVFYTGLIVAFPAEPLQSLAILSC